MKKIQNFWFYYKKHLLIGLAVLAVIGYLAAQRIASTQADYHIGLVQATPCSQEYLDDLQSRFTAVGEDTNGDGEILVKIHPYFVDLADNSENAGVENEETIAALDADLIGQVSGIFLLEDVEVFQRITNHMLSDSAIPFEDDLYLTIRQDADEIYYTLADMLS